MRTSRVAVTAVASQDLDHEHRLFDFNAVCTERESRKRVRLSARYSNTYVLIRGPIA